MKKPVFLVTGNDLAEAALALLQDYEVIYAGKAPTEDDIVALCRRHDPVAIIVRYGKVGAAAMEAAPGLRVISKHGSGTDTIDKQAAEARRIRVVAASGANAAAVAQKFASGDDPERPLHPAVALAFQSPPATLREAADRYGKLFTDVDSLRQTLQGGDSPASALPEQIERALDRPARNKYRELQQKVDRYKATTPGAPNHRSARDAMKAGISGMEGLSSGHLRELVHFDLESQNHFQ